MSWIVTRRIQARQWLVGLALVTAAATCVAWVYFLGLELVRGIIWTIGRS